MTSVFEDVVSLTEDVGTLTCSDQQQDTWIEDLMFSDEQETLIEDNIKRLDTLSTRGRWCGYKNDWTADNSIITYDSYFFTDTNMNVSRL